MDFHPNDIWHTCHVVGLERVQGRGRGRHLLVHGATSGWQDGSKAISNAEPGARPPSSSRHCVSAPGPPLWNARPRCLRTQSPCTRRARRYDLIRFRPRHLGLADGMIDWRRIQINNPEGRWKVPGVDLSSMCRPVSREICCRAHCWLLGQELARFRTKTWKGNLIRWV